MQIQLNTSSKLRGKNDYKGKNKILIANINDCK